jgi:hypothetical protein
MKIISNPWTATIVAVALFIAGVAGSVALRSGGHPSLGALVMGVCAAAGGCYLGTTIRLRRRRR